MKLKNKIAAIIIVLGFSIILSISLFYHFWSRHILMEAEQNSIVEISEAVSQEIDSHFEEITNTVKTVSSAPLIKTTLQESNAMFAKLSDHDKKEYITSLGEKWTETNDLEDPFLQTYLSNPVADYLKLQKNVIPKRYGEIFITNRDGVIIASTNKLTTINHSHKYWWIAAFDEGQGRIFLDDRGFDTSAEGYVLGVVVPINYNNEIIGMIKANVNIIDLLSHVIEIFEELHASCHVQIIRTGGLIVAERDTVPLSTIAGEQLQKCLLEKKSSSYSIEGNEVRQLVGTSVISITRGSEILGFGGNYESIDHILGNTGESWHTVICMDKTIIMENVKTTTQLLLGIGTTFTMLITIVAMYLSKRITSPIVKLAEFTKAVGNGALDNRITLKSTGEIGMLANAYNQMVENLQNTMASKNDLLAEVEKRKSVEKKLKELIVTDELTGIHNRRAAKEFLQQCIEKVERYDENLSVILLDIDHFKKVNDTYGHDVGDRVLISISQRLKEGIRNVDMVARIGGEEFLIILPQVEKEQAFVLAERLRITIAEYEFDKIKQLTVSMGVAEKESKDTFNSLLKRVDNCMYDSKKNGRNRVTMV